MLEFEKGPLMENTPYTHITPKLHNSPPELSQATLATMHGSSFHDDRRKALLDLNLVLKENLE
jgi:hypothetical protein